MARGLATWQVIDRTALLQPAIQHTAYRLVGEHRWLIASAQGRGLDLAAGLPVAEVLSEVEQCRSTWTGQLDGPLLHSTAKAAAVAQHAREHGLDLTDCAAYSDSVRDLPVLTAVGRPVAVNPEWPLVVPLAGK